jgi:hypothetical protein
MSPSLEHVLPLHEQTVGSFLDPRGWRVTHKQCNDRRGGSAALPRDRSASAVAPTRDW